MLPEVENISWRDLTGNKFIKNLHPAMVKDEGYLFMQRIRKTGEAVKSTFWVHYDRDYVIEYISRVICGALFTLGKEKILKLVEEAWDTYYSEEYARTSYNRRAS